MCDDDRKPVIKVTLPHIKGMTTIFRIGSYQCVVVKNDENWGWSIGALLRRGCYMVSHRKASEKQALEFINEFMDLHKEIAKTEIIIIPPPPRDKIRRKD
jgi:hypothetical protein